MAGQLAVVLSGGGARGAFQVGALDELIVRRGVTVDIVAGVSTGAIQAIAVAQNDIAGLIAEWTSIRGNDDIYRKRPLGPLGGFVGVDALYDARPLRARLRAFVDDAKVRATGKALRLGVVSLQSGAYRAIDESVPGLANWVYASSAMPVFFDPLRTQAADRTIEQWVDGGVRNVTPLADALHLNPRGVIVIRASPTPPDTKPQRYGDLIRIGLRAVSILQSEVSVNDTANAELINAMIAARGAQQRALAAAGVSGAAAAAILRPLDDQLARYRFAPIRIIEPLVDPSDTLEFDPAKIRAAIEAGRAAVAAAWPSLQPLL